MPQHFHPGSQDQSFPAGALPSSTGCGLLIPLEAPLRPFLSAIGVGFALKPVAGHLLGIKLSKSNGCSTSRRWKKLA